MKEQGDCEGGRKDAACSDHPRTSQVTKVHATGSKASNREEPMSTMDELWESLARGPELAVERLVDIYVEAYRSGLDKTFATRMQQHFEEWELPLDVYPQQFNHICMIFAGEMDTNVDEERVRREIREIYDFSCEAWGKGKLPVCDREAKINLTHFRKILHLVASIARIDEQYVVSHLVWCTTGFFEIQEDIFAFLRLSLHEHHRKGDTTDEDHDPLTQNDIHRLSRSSDLVDPTGKFGFKFEHIGRIFDSEAHHMAEHLARHLERHPGISKGGRMARHSHRAEEGQELHGIIGRTEFAVFMEALFQAAPKEAVERFKSPLNMVAMLYEACRAGHLALS